MSLLPSHKSKFDKKLDEFFKAELEGLDISLINTMALSCHPSLVPILAKSFDIDISGLPTKNARPLIQNAFSIHYYLGTVYGLKKALKSLDMDIAVTEWYEYGGKPYHFKVDVTVQEGGASLSEFKKLDEIINEFKNVRSICENIVIALRTKSAITSIKSVATSGEMIEILPYQTTDITLPKSKTFGFCTFYQDEILTIKDRDGIL